VALDQGAKGFAVTVAGQQNKFVVRSVVGHLYRSSARGRRGGYPAQIGRDCEYQTMSSALDSVRILDFSRILAGPFATMVLGDLGAEVVKVERPGRGDETRSWGPPHDGRGQATYFDAINRNKASVVLDLAEPHDVKRARRMAAEADVIVENFRPGVMERLGLGWDELHEANPGLIYCSVTGFGRQEGAEMPGYDLLVQAVGGLMSITGDPAGEPQKVGVALVDVIAGLFASVGILAALRHRDLTGDGQRVEVNLLSSLLAALVNQASGFTAGGVVPGRIGNAHPSISPYELYPCREGALVVAVGNERQFAAMAEVLGMPEAAADPRFQTNPDRVAHRSELRVMIVDRLATRTASEWVEDLMAARVPAGVVNDIAGAFALAERLGLDPIVDVPAETGGEIRLPRNPIGLSLTPPTYRSAPPTLPDRETPLADRATAS
jgi:crotonobetainyl-CoA:carnitine CoA-transferase CaiB-like acyl-CoA transferase